MPAIDFSSHEFQQGRARTSLAPERYAQRYIMEKHADWFKAAHHKGERLVDWESSVDKSARLSVGSRTHVQPSSETSADIAKQLNEQPKLSQDKRGVPKDFRRANFVACPIIDINGKNTSADKVIVAQATDEWHYCTKQPDDGVSGNRIANKARELGETQPTMAE